VKWDKNNRYMKSACDYSDSKDWNDCVSSFAKAQLDFPEGVGFNNSGFEKVINIKKAIVGHRPLWEIPPREFRRVIYKLRTTYQKIKKASENGKI